MYDDATDSHNTQEVYLHAKSFAYPVWSTVSFDVTLVAIDLVPPTVHTSGLHDAPSLSCT